MACQFKSTQRSVGNKYGVKLWAFFEIQNWSILGSDEYIEGQNERASVL